MDEIETEMSSLKTDGQRRRFARDLSILTALRSGLSQRDTARLFGVSQSRIHQIQEQAQSRIDG